MHTNNAMSFRSFFEDTTAPKMFTTTVTRDYLGQNFYWDGSTFPITNPGGVRIIDSMGGKRVLQSGTFIGIEPTFAKQLKKEPKPNQKVPVLIGNVPDAKIPTQSNTAHGKPSKFGGEKFTVPYSTFVWLIQPPAAPGGGAAGGMPSAGGMPMGGGGGMPMPGGPMGGATPPGGMPNSSPMGGGMPAASPMV